MNSLNGEKIKIAINKAYQALENNKDAVNKLNVFPVPDGDTGTNMSLTMKSAVEVVNSLENPTVGDCVKAMNRGSLMGARGNSGVILSQLFRGLSSALDGEELLTIENANRAFKSSKETAYKAVMKPTEGTILTVARRMAEFSERNYEKYDDIVEYLKDVHEEGERALEETPEMLVQLKEAGVVDAGGQGLLVLFEGAIKSLEDKSIDSIIVSLDDDSDEPSFEELENVDKKHAYSVSFILKTNNPDANNFYNQIKEIGNSTAEKISDDSIEVKSHTNHPGNLIEKATSYGHIININVENILLSDDDQDEEVVEIEEKKDYGFVAVSLGDGFNTIFEQLGVDQVISGGQTMNPSTADLYNAVEKVNSDNVFIFPNNKNIIMSAKQVNELSDKNVYTIETRNIPQAFSCLLEFNPESSIEENIESMNDVLSDIKTIELTYSIRDTVHNGKEIKEGDLIGLLDGELLVNGKDDKKLIEELLKNIEIDDSSLVTIYYGEDVTEDQANDLADELTEKYDVDLDIMYGGQPLYYYIISVE